MDAITTYGWTGLLLFARIGSVLMLAPGWGEAAVPVRFRLTAALLATAVLAPSLSPGMPSAPASMGGTISLVLGELLIGIMFGAGARILMSALQVGGQLIGMQSGLAMAQQFDPTQGSSGALISVFLSMIAVVLMLNAGVHRMMLQAAADSYSVFPPGGTPPVGDAANWGLSAVSAAFRIGLQIAAPVLVFALVFNLALGLISRLIPQVQIFFIAQPAQVIMGLSVTAFVLGGGLLIWIEALERYARFETMF